MYQFEFCPFRHVTQFEINHTFWDENEKRAKNGRPLLVELSKEKLKELGIGMVQSDGGAGGGKKSESGGDASESVGMGNNGGLMSRVLSFFGWSSGVEEKEEVVAEAEAVQEVAAVVEEEVEVEVEVVADAVVEEVEMEEVEREEKAVKKEDNESESTVLLKANEEGVKTIVGVYSGWLRKKKERTTTTTTTTTDGDISAGLDGAVAMKFIDGHSCKEMFFNLFCLILFLLTKPLTEPLTHTHSFFIQYCFISKINK